MTEQTAKTYFTEPPNYTHFQQNKPVLIVAAEAVLTQTLTIMSPPNYSEEFLNILIHSNTFKSLLF